MIVFCQHHEIPAVGSLDSCRRRNDSEVAFLLTSICTAYIFPKLKGTTQNSAPFKFGSEYIGSNYRRCDLRMSAPTMVKM